MLMVKYISGN